MKVLFISNASGPDYLSDTVFHGGKSLLKNDFYDYRRMWYMYDDVQNKETLYGRGFTLYGKVNPDYHSPINNVEELIENKFFDKIVYGSIWRCLDLLDLVTNHYNKNNIIFLDGEDDGQINHSIVSKGTYFKREYYTKVDGVYPISFSIPEELILNTINNKTKLISDIVPNFSQSYHYTNELDYYNEYSNSWYAITMKKGGWDCLRHYEIMMNGCIPIFNDLEHCPDLTLTDLPKKELINMSVNRKMDTELNEFILDYTRNNLTTKHTINKILN
jgi:hypothetical protein